MCLKLLQCGEQTGTRLHLRSLVTYFLEAMLSAVFLALLCSE